MPLSIPRLRMLAICLSTFAWLTCVPLYGEAGSIVGRLGDPKLLQFNGCKLMNAERVRDELQKDFELEVAATPSAPLDEYLAVLQRRLEVGYQASGFPNVKLDISANADKSAVIVKVEEGQRYLAGEVKITGTKTVDVAVIIKELTTPQIPSRFPTQLDAAAGVLAIGYWQDTSDAPQTVWETGKPASFDPLSKRRLHRQVVEAFLRHGYFWLKCDVKPVVQGDKAILAVDVVAEGRPAEVDRVEVVGNKKNTVTDIVRYLHVEKGTLIDLAQMRLLQQRLWDSGRFMNHAVAAVIDKANPGRCYLHVELDELEESPPLSAPTQRCGAGLFEDVRLAQQAGDGSR